MGKGKNEGGAKYRRWEQAQNSLGEADPIAISLAQHAININAHPSLITDR